MLTCFVLSVAVSSGELQESERFADEALTHDPQCTPAMLSLAQLALRRGDWDKCTAQCLQIRTADPLHRPATLLHSEALLRSSAEAEVAAAPLLHYLALLPADYVVLEKAMTLLRRAGQLPEAKRLLSVCALHDQRAHTHPGYHYCVGLYARYTRDLGTAIASFNLARKDERWSVQALAHMIELYLNPDQEGIWEERDSSSASFDGANGNGGAGAMDDETRLHIAAAEELLKALRPQVGEDDPRATVLENYCLLATRNKVAVDRAMASFAALLDANQEFLPAVLGMATGFMIERNPVGVRYDTLSVSAVYTHPAPRTML